MDRFTETDPLTFAARTPGDDWQDEVDNDTGCTPGEMSGADLADTAAGWPRRWTDPRPRA